MKLRLKTTGPADSTAEAPTKTPTETATEAPVKTPVETPVEASTEIPAEIVEAVVEETAEKAPTAPSGPEDLESSTTSTTSTEPDEAPAPRSEKIGSTPVSLLQRLSSSWAGDRYARRRFALAAVCAAAVGVVGANAFSPTPPPNELATEAEVGEVGGFADDAAASMPALPRSLVEVLQDAETFKSVHGTYVGFSAENTLVASSQHWVVLAGWFEQSCTYAASENGVHRGPLVDPTGAACTENEIEKVQSELNLASSAAVDESLVKINATVAQLRHAAAVYASLSYADGKPALAGLTELPVPGTRLRSIASDNASAVFEITDETLCRTVTIYADSTINPGVLSPC